MNQATEHRAVPADAAEDEPSPAPDGIEGAGAEGPGAHDRAPTSGRVPLASHLPLAAATVWISGLVGAALVATEAEDITAPANATTASAIFLAGALVSWVVARAIEGRAHTRAVSSEVRAPSVILAWMAVVVSAAAVGRLTHPGVGVVLAVIGTAGATLGEFMLRFTWPRRYSSRKALARNFRWRYGGRASRCDNCIAADLGTDPSAVVMPWAELAGTFNHRPFAIYDFTILAGDVRADLAPGRGTVWVVDLPVSVPSLNSSEGEMHEFAAGDPREVRARLAETGPGSALEHLVETTPLLVQATKQKPDMWRVDGEVLVAISVRRPKSQRPSPKDLIVTLDDVTTFAHELPTLLGAVPSGTAAGADTVMASPEQEVVCGRPPAPIRAGLALWFAGQVALGVGVGALPLLLVSGWFYTAPAAVGLGVGTQALADRRLGRRREARRDGPAADANNPEAAQDERRGEVAAASARSEEATITLPGSREHPYDGGGDSDGN